MNPSEELDLVHAFLRSGSEWIVGERRSRLDRGNRGNCAAVVEKSHAETRIFEQDLLEVILSRDRIDSGGT